MGRYKKKSELKKPISLRLTDLQKKYVLEYGRGSLQRGIDRLVKRLLPKEVPQVEVELEQPEKLSFLD